MMRLCPKNKRINEHNESEATEQISGALRSPAKKRNDDELTSESPVTLTDNKKIRKSTKRYGSQGKDKTTRVNGASAEFT